MGTVTEFRHSAEIGRVFNGNDKLAYLSNWGPAWGLLESQDAFIFIDNHDNQRGHGAGGNILTYKNSKKYKMATAFMLAYPYGITRVMSSFAFDNTDQGKKNVFLFFIRDSIYFFVGPPQDSNGNIISPLIKPDDTCGNGWICEHRWRQIYNMIRFTNVVKNTTLNNWWSNGDQQIAFCRGDKGFIAFTNWGDLKQTLQTCLPSGIYCDVISGTVDSDGKCTGKTINVQIDGKAYIELGYNEEDGVLAIHIEAKQYLKSKL